jgi:hypothetical protein
MWIKEIKEQKVWNRAADGNRTQDLTHWNEGTWQQG